MATTAMDYENANGDRFEEDAPRYDRDRSASPRRDDVRDDARDEGIDSGRRRSLSPVPMDRSNAKNEAGSGDDDGSSNPGTNLFVTGIHPRITEEQVTRLFEKYGEVEKCQIMKDPHSGESRGFGFVNMVLPDQADAAKEGLQGEVIEGRTLSIEKARRARPRTPTPGKYFGPPKRELRGGGRFGGGGRFDDRRRDGYGGSGGGGGGYRDDGRYRSYREDRGYDRTYERSYDRPREDRYEREDRGYRGGGSGGGYDRRDRDEGHGAGGRFERYGGGGGGGRDDRYGAGRGGDDRRGPGYERERYDRVDRDARPPRDGPPAAAGGYDAPPRGEARESYGTR
ncbi:hypothetical protein P8C59_000329 [Phyllachora maydis]|uniref:RRM domain-containing protein n=1 Tax=Phyllachora maydis TaxID=1825666 RepID=A0AAD9HX13_9PEZI|nr:hypothetical protein P8C59_000329 [Phyllachora maydis]